MSRNLGLILHAQAGDNSPWGWFERAGAQESSTWWASRTGVVEQYVDSSTKAWAQGSGNDWYCSVETEGFPSSPLTTAQVEAVAHIYAFGVKEHDWPLRLATRPGDSGLGWHGMGGKAWGGHTGCPGPARLAQRELILSRAALLVPLRVSAFSAAKPEQIQFGMPQRFEDKMIRTPIHIPSLGNAGEGWIQTDIPYDKFVTCVIQGPAPERDGYNWANIYWSVNDTGGKTVVEFEGGMARQPLDVILWSVE